MKKGLSLALTTIIALASISAVSAKNYIEPTKTILISQHDKSPIKSTTQEIKENKDYIKENLKIPVISGITDKKIEKITNERFSCTVLRFKENLEKEALEWKKDWDKNFSDLEKKEGWTFRPYEISSDYKINYTGNNLISVTIDLYEYTGGAHGNTERVVFNLDTKTGIYLIINDLFKTNDFQNIIKKEVKTQIKANKDNYFDNALETVDNMIFNKFYIEDNNVVIYFDHYEIAPYCCGMPEVKIPLSKFGSNLKTEFFK